MALLEASGLCKVYDVDSRRIPVLDQVDLHVEAGTFLVISGSSGSGKTTLLTLLSGATWGAVCMIVVGVLQMLAAGLPAA